MRFVFGLAVAAIAFCGVNVLRADDIDTDADLPSVKFDGHTLLLAWQNSERNPTIREFIPQGQDLESWTILASIRDYPMLEDPFLVCGALAKRSGELNDGAQGRVTENEATGDAVVDFLAWPEDKSYVEFNVFRYRKAEQGGLIAEQYAVRDYKDPETFVKNLKPIRDRLVKEMLKNGLDYDAGEQDTSETANNDSNDENSGNEVIELQESRTY